MWPFTLWVGTRCRASTAARQRRPTDQSGYEIIYSALDFIKGVGEAAKEQRVKCRAVFVFDATPPAESQPPAADIIGRHFLPPAT